MGSSLGGGSYSLSHILPPRTEPPLPKSAFDKMRIVLKTLLNRSKWPLLLVTGRKLTDRRMQGPCVQETVSTDPGLCKETVVHDAPSISMPEEPWDPKAQDLMWLVHSGCRAAAPAHVGTKAYETSCNGLEPFL
jgi:hypothetical protein